MASRAPPRCIITSRLVLMPLLAGPMYFVVYIEFIIVTDMDKKSSG